MNEVIIYFRDLYTKVGDNIDVLPLVKHKKDIISYGSRLPSGEVYNDHRIRSFPIIITKLIFSNEGEIIHIFCGLNWTIPFVILTSKFKKRRIIYSPLGQLLPKALEKKSYLKRFIINTLYNYAFKKVDIWHLTSQYEVDTTINFQSLHSKVFLLGLPLHSDLSFNQRTKEHLKNTFLFFGRFDIWQKGLDLMFEALAKNRILLEKLNYQVVIAGRASDSEVNAVAELITNNGLEDTVQLEANVSNERRKELYASSTFFIHPSRVEGFARSMRDAVCAGIPVITTYDANASDLVLSEEIGWVSEFSVKNLTEVIEAAILVDDKVYSEKVNACADLKNKYSSGNYATSLTKFYDLQKSL